MTIDKVLQLVEELKDAAIEYGRLPYQALDPNWIATRSDLKQAKIALTEAIRQLANPVVERDMYGMTDTELAS